MGMALQSDHEFAPTEIARAVFPTAFRGYDQDAVRRYLGRLAAALEHEQEYGGLGALEGRPPADDRIEELEAEIAELQGEIKELELELVQRSVDGEMAEEETAGRGGSAFDEHRAIELLGQETARVLESARSAAADILKRAEKQAASLKAEAKRELAQARRRAAALVAEKEAESEELLTRLAERAEADARRLASEAEEHRQAVVEESSKILAESETRAAAQQAGAEDRARQIVADAETLRQQVIAELVAERRQAQTDLDRMIGARDRLAMSLAVARSELDEVADALVDVVPLTGGPDDPEPDEVADDEVARLIEKLDEAEEADGLADEGSDAPADDDEGSGHTVDGAIGDELEPTVEMPAIGVEPATPVITATEDAAGEAAPEADAGPAAAVEPEGADGAGVFDGAAPPDDVEVMSIGDIDVDTLPDSDDVLNRRPDDGSPLSLVEGFSTIELADDDRSGAAPVIDLTDRDGGGGRRSRREREPEVAPVGALVDAPSDPADIITTVACRAAGAQPDRNRGDLLLDREPGGALPAAFEARDIALTKAGPNLRRQLRRALNDDQSEILERLRGGRGEIRTDELPPYGDQIDHYLAPLRLGLVEIARAGARAAGADDSAPASLDNLVRQLARFIVDRVRTPTIEAIEQADHTDRERILEPVRALYRDFRNIGLPDLTEDALHEAFAIGLYDGIAESAPVAWVVDPRTDPDPVCEVNRDRQDLHRGQAFPSGHVRPLSLPGCRCLVVPAD